MPVQQPKDYQVITTVAALEAYCLRCQETGLASFDYETAPTEDWRDDDKAALDPWKSDVCTLSIAAAPHESRVMFISHKKGTRHFEPMLTREAARKAVMDTVDRLLFQNKNVLKIAVNLVFETKFTAKQGKYILAPVADPLVAWVRCLQIVAPEQITDPKKPARGKGLKPMTKKYLGVELGDFLTVLRKHGVRAFDEISTDEKDALVYSAEDSDYGLQQYLYWLEIARQIPGYDAWLHTIEMPFARVIGLMEYWGMYWDKDLADTRLEEARNMQEDAANEIKKIAKETFNLDVDPGKSGKTGDVRKLIFDHFKIPAVKFGTTGPSLDEEALINMGFMIEHKLHSLDEEQYLAADLPDAWLTIDPETPDSMDKAVRMAVRIAQRPDFPHKAQALRLLELLKNIQRYSTLISSHIEGRAKFIHPVTGRIHAQYTPWTETARLNSFSPNGQNVPRMDNDDFKIRRFYVPQPGKVLFFIDFSGFELKIMAWRSGDETMIEIFKTGGDMHKTTAVEITGKPFNEITKKERQDAKPANFGRPSSYAEVKPTQNGEALKAIA